MALINTNGSQRPLTVSSSFFSSDNIHAIPLTSSIMNDGLNSSIWTLLNNLFLIVLRNEMHINWMTVSNFDQIPILLRRNLKHNQQT